MKLPTTAAELNELNELAATLAAERAERDRVAALMLSQIPTFTPTINGFTADEVETHRARTRGLYTMATDANEKPVLILLTVQTSDRISPAGETPARYADRAPADFTYSTPVAGYAEADGSFTPHNWLREAIKKANGKATPLVIPGMMTAADAIAQAGKAAKAKKGKAE